MQSKFIVVEGIEGAGKSTAITHITAFLNSHDMVYTLTREPGGTEMAEDIRDIIKHNYNKEIIYGETEVLLLYAARLQLVNNVIKPELAANKWVIADRHDLSTIAYQSGGRGLKQEFITKIKQEVLGDFSYDLCLYLDVEPELGLKRAMQRGKLDRIEQESIEFFNKVRLKYLELAKLDKKIIIIDASKSEQEVKQSILDVLRHQYKF